MTAPAPVAAGYSAANAERFGWAGFTPDRLQPERVAVLDEYVVGPRVLDAGCGSGAFTDHFARKGFDAVGVDKHDFCLEAARGQGYHGTFVRADLADRLPFADGEFDTAFCCDVLEHVDDYPVLRELARVARRRVVFTVPQDLSGLLQYRLIAPTYRDPTHLRYYTAEMLAALTASVAPARVRMVGEQPVDVTGFARDHLWPKSRVPGVGRVYNQLVRYLTARGGPSDVFMNWCVVLDK